MQAVAGSSVRRVRAAAHSRWTSPGSQTAASACAVPQENGSAEQPILGSVEQLQPTALERGERPPEPSLDAQASEPLLEPLPRFAGGYLYTRTGFVAAKLAVSVVHDRTTRLGSQI